MKKLLSIISLICLTGCVNYQSQFAIAGVGKFTLPKDSSFNWLQVSIPTTNGAITLTITNGVFKMNPAVIDAKTAHDVAVIDSVRDAVLAAMAAAPK